MERPTKQPIISIIVPVYNVAKYLSRCLLSLADLTVSYEIIIVNDGSSDQSLDIAQKFQQRFSDKEIYITSQVNKGLSAARNTGIQLAKGQYIAFIDSDDFVDPIHFSKLIHQTISHDLDIGIGKFIYFGIGEERGIGQINETLVQSHIIAGITALDFLRPEVWCKVYRRTLLLDNTIQFVESLLFEDEVFNLNVMLLAQRVKYFDLPFYFYYQRQNSIINSVDSLTRYQHYYRLAMEIFALKSLTPVKAIQNLVCRRAWFFLWESLPRLYEHDKNIFAQKRMECRSLLLNLQEIPEISGKDKQIIELLLSETPLTITKK